MAIEQFPARVDKVTPNHVSCDNGQGWVGGIWTTKPVPSSLARGCTVTVKLDGGGEVLGFRFEGVWYPVDAGPILTP